MSGVSSIVGAGFALTLLVQTMLVISSSLEMFAELPDTIEHGRANDFKISVVEIGQDGIVAEIANLGPKDLSVKALLLSDMFMSYVGEAGIVKRVRLEYRPGGQGLGWEIIAVKTGDYRGELLDPIDLTSGKEGVWNVGETIVAEIVLGEQPNATLPILIKLVAIP